MPSFTPSNSTLPNASSAYARFQRKLAWHALGQFAASLRGSAEVILLMAGQILLVALALLSGPLWVCAIWIERGNMWLATLALWAAYSALMALPMVLLRQRLLPPEVVLWSRALPLPAHAHLRAHAATVALLVQPLALGYLISSAALLTQSPELVALLPLGVGLQLASLALTFGLGVGVLQWRRRRLSRAAGSHTGTAFRTDAMPPRVQAMQADTFRSTPLRPRLLHIWHRLFWLPFWRLENGIGVQQCILFGSTCLMFALWLYPVSPLPRGILGWFASSAILILTDRGYKAVQEQRQLMAQHLRALPLHFGQLSCLASALSLAPAALILATVSGWLYLHTGQIHIGVARWYLGTQILAHLALLACGRFNEAARARILILGSVILTAMGTELWQ